MSSRAERYGYTTLTLTDPEVAEDFRDLRDASRYNTAGLLRRMLQAYEEHEDEE